MTIGTITNYSSILSTLEKESVFSFDFETTGLRPFDGAEIFSMAVATEKESFYFNFNKKADHLGKFAPIETVLAKHKVLSDIIRIFADKKIYAHNLKFELSFLKALGLSPESRAICTEALSRIVNNQLNSYKLAKLGELIGHKKDSTVDSYITKHKLYTEIDTGAKQKKKHKHFDLVPFEIISKYAMQDARVCFELGKYVESRLEQMGLEQAELGLPPIKNIVENEIALTPVLCSMEQIGIKIDRAYTEKAYEYQRGKYKEIERKFKVYTGIDFEDGPKTLKAAFEKMGLKHGVTAKGNPSFSDENLPDNTLGNMIRDYRHAYKFAQTYYKNFLTLADSNDIIHCNFRQGGTSTGRMSCAEPNLQNVPKRGEDENKYPVRACFIPRPGFSFFMPDYDQQEYRLLLDQAAEMELIAKVNQGLDVHQATGELCNLPRQDAKQVNFAQVYGQGLDALAVSLKKSVSETREIRAKYFKNLGRVKALIKALISVVDSRGFVVNPFGRRLMRPKDGSYMIPNHYIQGGCGDVVKKAMILCDKFLNENNYKSRMLLQIHDELIFEIHDDELFIKEQITKIMLNAYDAKYLKLTVGSDSSQTNWYAKN